MLFTRSTRIVLVGHVGESAVGELTEHCRRLADQGWNRVVLDASAVTGCDGAGLQGLVDLQGGWSGLTVGVIGAHWSQFLPALTATPLGELADTRGHVRGLLDRSGSHRPRRSAAEVAGPPRHHPGAVDGRAAQNRSHAGA